VIEHDQNYTSSVVLAPFHKPGGGEGALIRGEALILKGRLFEGAAHLRGRR